MRDTIAQVEIMADFALAMELQDTAQWIASYVVTTSLAPNQHLDRISRAIRFLHGERTMPNLDEKEIVRLRRNDPMVAALFAIAYREAAERIHAEYAADRQAQELDR